jgi:hypothetical protein
MLINENENTNENDKIICKKTSFANEGIALSYIKKLQATSKRERVPQRAYLCEKCMNWHLTSTIDYTRDKVIVGLNEKIAQLTGENQFYQAKIEKLIERLEQANEKIYYLSKELKSQ